MVDEVGPQTWQEVEEVIDTVNVAINSYVDASGFSAAQRVLANNPRTPGALQGKGDGGDLDYCPATLPPQDDVLYRAAEIRRAALKAMAEHEATRKLSVAERVRSRPLAGPWAIGETV